VSLAWCQLASALDKLIWLYTLIMLVYAVLSWVPDLRGSWSRYIDMLVEPALRPLRRVIPPVGGFDLAFMALLLILWLVDNFLIRPQMFACF
jgi:YggT family protein